MSTIILMAETGSDITPELAKEYGIAMVPMHVNFDDETFDDGSFSPEKIRDFYKETGRLPKTSGSTPEDFTKVFDELQEKYPESRILYLAYSAATTCSYQSAVIAAEDRENITILDTKQVSVGQANVVITMAEWLKANPDATIEQAVDKVYELIERAKMCFVPDNLEFLRAGGRVSNAAYIGSRLLSIHPCIEILDGKLVATKKYRGKMTKVTSQLVKDYTANYNLDTKEIWLVYTVGLSEEVKDAVKAALTECGFASQHWIQANGVITTHGGPAAFGLAGFSKEK